MTALVGTTLASVTRLCAAAKARLFAPKPKRFYGVGDVAPASLLNRDIDDGPMGAMMSIDPQTNRITAIFVP